MKRRCDILRNDGGAALVEFALTLPVVILAFAFACDFTFFSFYQLELEHVAAVTSRELALKGDRSKTDLQHFVNTLDVGIPTHKGEIVVESIPTSINFSYSAPFKSVKDNTCKTSPPIPFSYYHPLTGGCIEGVVVQTKFPIFFKTVFFDQTITLTATAEQAVQYPWGHHVYF